MPLLHTVIAINRLTCKLLKALSETVYEDIADEKLSMTKRGGYHSQRLN